MDQARQGDVRALREGEQVDVMALGDQGAHHGQHGQGRAAHLEEGLRGEEEDAQPRALRQGGRGRRAHAVGDSVEAGSQSSVTCSPRKRSASMAAMQPVPAAVAACR